MIDKRGAAAAVGLGALGIAAYALLRPRLDVDVERARAARSVTIRGDATALYERWRDAGWASQTFGGAPVEIVDEVPGRRLEWRTKRRGAYRAGASLTLGAAPANRGTQARLAVHLDGPLAPAVAAFSRPLGASPAQLAMETLRAFKALAETGEIPKAVRS